MESLFKSIIKIKKKKKISMKDILKTKHLIILRNDFNSFFFFGFYSLFSYYIVLYVSSNM